MQVSVKRLATMSESEYRRLSIEAWDAEYESALRGGVDPVDALAAADAAVEDLDSEREAACRGRRS